MLVTEHTLICEWCGGREISNPDERMGSLRDRARNYGWETIYWGGVQRDGCPTCCRLGVVFNVPRTVLQSELELADA